MNQNNLNQNKLFGLSKENAISILKKHIQFPSTRICDDVDQDSDVITESCSPRLFNHMTK